jgi:hypothetical protein
MVEAIHLQLLLATFAGWATRQQAQVVSYLNEEDRVLKEALCSRTGCERDHITGEACAARRVVPALESP